MDATILPPNLGETIVDTQPEGHSGCDKVYKKQQFKDWLLLNGSLDEPVWTTDMLQRDFKDFVTIQSKKVHVSTDLQEKFTITPLHALFFHCKQVVQDSVKFATLVRGKG